MKYGNQWDTDARPGKKIKDGPKGAKKKKAAVQLSKAMKDALPTKYTRPPTVKNQTLVSSLPDVWKTSKDLGLRLFISLCDDQTIRKLLRSPSLVSGPIKNKVGATDPLLLLNVLFNAWTRAGSEYQKMMEDRYHEEKEAGGRAFGAQTATPGPSNVATGGNQAATAKPSSSMKPLGLACGANASMNAAKTPYRFKGSAASAGRHVADALEPKVSKAVAVNLNNNVIDDALPPVPRALPAKSTSAKVPDYSQRKATVVEPFFSVPASRIPVQNLPPAATTNAFNNNAHAYAPPRGPQNAFAMSATVASGGLAMAVAAQPPTYIHGKTASRLHAHNHLPTGTAPKAVQLIPPHEYGHCSKPPFSALLECCVQRKLPPPSCHFDQVPGAAFPRFQATITFCGENFISSVKTNKQSAKTDAAQMALNALPRLRLGK